MKRKTIIHRIVDADKFDSDIEKFLDSVKEQGMEEVDTKIAVGQNHLIAHILYAEKAKSGSKRSSKA